MRVWPKGDAALFVSAFADDGLELRPDGSVMKGREQILELVKASMQRLGPGVERPKTFEILFVTVWKRQRDGRWKIVVDMPVRQD